jgi:cell wall-associated NlpC family hydrolase
LEDWVAVAETFVGAPYLFGGKTWDGIDCSGLVQLAVQTAGGRAPRDSDMQEAELGEPLLPDHRPFARGDLVFWKAHVGVMVDETRLLHANGHHMQTVIEPVDETFARLSARGIEPTAVRRLPPRIAMAGPVA